MKVEAIRTPTDPAALGRALALAWFKLWGRMPERPSVNLLMAQWAHETGRGKSCFNFGLGNAKATARWDGDYCERPCNELLGKALAEDAVSRAGKRPDGTPDAVVTGSVATEMIVWFYPPNPASRFRAFDTLEAGALDYLSLLADRFSGAWGDVIAGEPTRFAQSLRALKYYTAPVETYAAALRSLAREYSHLEIDLTEPPAGITGRLAADQDAMFRTFTPEDPDAALYRHHRAALQHAHRDVFHARPDDRHGRIVGGHQARRRRRHVGRDARHRIGHVARDHAPSRRRRRAAQGRLLDTRSSHRARRGCPV